MGVIASIAAGVAGGAATIISGNKAAKEAAAARAQAGDQQAEAMLQLREAVERLEAVGVPSIEAQRIVLEEPELVGLQEIHQLATSKMEDIEIDPQLKETQMASLGQIKDIADTGVTAGEKAQEQLDYRTVAGEESARRKAILQKMAERGMSGSGQELAALLQGSQSAAERRAQMQAQLIKDREARRLSAISQAAQLGGQIRGQDFGEQSQIANAADAIARFNIQNRTNVEAANLERQQRIADEKTRLANLQEQYNKDLVGKQYQQQMDKAKSIASAKTGTAQAGMTQAGQTIQAGRDSASGYLQQGAAVAGLLGNIANTAITYGNKPTSTPKTTIASNYDPFKTAKDGGVIYQDGGVVPMVLPPESNQPHPMSPPIQSPSNTGYAGGGIAVISEHEEVIPGDDFSGDRVDAKINSGEMVLNIEQQQRLMDLLKGYRSLSGLGDENIVEKPPVDNPEIELPPDLPSTPPPSITQPMADGGIAGDDFISKLSDVHNKMTTSENQLKDAQKDTRAKIKALETLMGKK